MKTFFIGIITGLLSVAGMVVLLASFQARMQGVLEEELFGHCVSMDGLMTIGLGIAFAPWILIMLVSLFHKKKNY